MGDIRKRIRLGNIKIPQEPHIFKSELEDGSFRALVYDKATTTATVKFSEDKFYDYSACSYRSSYRAMPEIQERKLLLTIIIFKKSAHTFIVILSTAKKTAYHVAKTYDEVNEILLPLFKKKPKKGT